MGTNNVVRPPSPRGSHRPWFYWIAPLLAIGFAGVMANLIAQYYVKVGRLEVKGRPRK